MAIFDVAAMVFWSAQGAVVFAGAWAGLALTRRSGVWAKVRAMTLSYLAWMLTTALIFGRLGGGQPFATGSGPLLIALTITAAISSIAFLCLWLLWPLRQATTDEGLRFSAR